MNSPEYRDAMRELPNARTLVREEYGDDAYDRYLYLPSLGLIWYGLQGALAAYRRVPGAGLPQAVVVSFFAALEQRKFVRRRLKPFNSRRSADRN